MPRALRARLLPGAARRPLPEDAAPVRARQAPAEGRARRGGPPRARVSPNSSRTFLRRRGFGKLGPLWPCCNLHGAGGGVAPRAEASGPPLST